MYDFLIVGGGPAGIQLGYFLSKTKFKYVILESDEVGHFFTQFPIQRKLISINKVHFPKGTPHEVIGRWDWNSLLTDDQGHLFKDYSKEYFPGAETLVTYLTDYAKKYNLNVITNSRVEKVVKLDGFFLVRDNHGLEFKSKVVIMATGFTQAYVPAIFGDALKSGAVPYYQIDKNLTAYTGKRVLILGKGNSAFEVANALLDYAAFIHLSSPSPLKFAWSSHHVGHLRSVNTKFLDSYLLKGQNGILNGAIDSLTKVNNVWKAVIGYRDANEVEELEYDEVIMATGFKFDSGMFDESCKVDLIVNKRFPDMTPKWESKNISDLFFAGTLMQGRDFKKTQSGFIHGFRYNIKTLFNFLLEKYHNIPFPSVLTHFTEETAPKILTELLIKEANSTVALWQQTGFLGDVFVIHKNAIEHYRWLPIDYITACPKFMGCTYFLLTLEYGSHELWNKENVFATRRVNRHDTDNSHLSPSLHPIIKKVVDGKVVAIHHVIENLFGVWNSKEHKEPLLRWVNKWGVTQSCTIPAKL